MDEITLTVIEIIIGIVVEGVLLALIFNMISSKSEERMRNNLQSEINNIEKQNKFDFEQTLKALEQARTDIINQVKESHKSKEAADNEI